MLVCEQVVVETGISILSIHGPASPPTIHYADCERRRHLSLPAINSCLRSALLTVGLRLGTSLAFNGRMVTPIKSIGATSLSTVVVADGFMLVSRNREELESGEIVEVWLYD
jgi:hypothetical protein